MISYDFPIISTLAALRFYAWQPGCSRAMDLTWWGGGGSGVAPARRRDGEPSQASRTSQGPTDSWTVNCCPSLGMCPNCVYRNSDVYNIPWIDWYLNPREGTPAPGPSRRGGVEGRVGWGGRVRVWGDVLEFWFFFDFPGSSIGTRCFLMPFFNR